jgi:hypothetical protein
MKLLLCVTALATSALAGPAAHAAGGKLPLTGGVGSIDGAAGGGLTPWALTGGLAAGGQWGGTATLTRAETADYGLTVAAATVTWSDRFELSLARQTFDVRNNLAPLGQSDLQLKLDILGLKWRVAGNAVLDTDTWRPQIALGLLYKRLDAGALAPTLTGPLGADDQGSELYASATKLFLASGVLINGTLRATKANQGGLLGFGGAQSDRVQWHPEVSVGWLLRRDLVVGAEFRAKPDHLNRSVLGPGALKEDDWWDLFVAWAPHRQLSITAAWVDLGHIAPAVQPRRQTGAYLSAQFSF